MENQLLSQRGKEKFCNEGHIYVFDKFSRDGTVKFWRCEERGRCKARIHTIDENIVKKINVHSHSGSAAKVEADHIITKIKQRSEETVEPTVQVLNECTGGISQAAQGALPTLGALRKTVRRKRNETNAAPANPHNLESLVIPERYQVYETQPGITERFLLADSGPNGDRILIFGRTQSLIILRDSKMWYADGTFSITPHLFGQIYSILAEAHGGVHPILYALLPNKLQNTYIKMFDMVKNLQPGLNPDSISCDFELAAFNAMKHCFEGVQVDGCFFHLVQNMQKHLSQLGLRVRYNTDADFALKAKMISSLAFVPIEDIDRAIDALSEETPAELQPILDWFEDYYVGRMNRRGDGRRPAMFPVAMWSLYNRVLQENNRTNNHAEAAHRRLQIELGMDHPTIWKLIDALRKVQQGRDLYYEQLVAGRAPPIKLRKYREADARILAIVRDYRNRNIIEYLRGISHNYT